MYRIMIADDEEIERKAFKLLITKNFGDIFQVEEAANGIELINRVSGNTPDIAVVDINMPGMNGLEAIKLLKEKGVKTKVIIYTAHGQFEYAQEALRLGADDYILKPAKRDRILSVVNKYRELIDSEKEKEQEQIKLRKVIEDLSPIIEMDFMSSIFLGDINISNLSVFLDTLGIRFVSGFFITLLLPWDTGALSAADPENSRLKIELLDYLKNEIKSICNCIVSSIVNDKISIFVPLEKQLPLFQFKMWTMELAELLGDKIKERFEWKPRFGIGRQYDSMEGLTDSYRESVSVLADKSVKSSIKYFGDVYSESFEVGNSLLKYENELGRLIMAGDGKGCEKLLEKAFSQRNADTPLELEKENLLVFLISLQKYLDANGVDTKKESYSLKTCYNQIMGEEDGESLKNLIKGKILDMIESVALMKRDKINRFVKTAATYVDENFMNDLSLEMVAEKTGISPYYISRLFKQELGLNFIDYLTQIRIKNAILLMKTKDYSIKELSEKVGYYNPTYFSKVFKKFTRKTIREYRMDL